MKIRAFSAFACAVAEEEFGDVHTDEGGGSDGQHTAGRHRPVRRVQVRPDPGSQQRGGRRFGGRYSPRIRLG